jgi:uncharacterized Rmd1/YagE family protein
MQFAHDRLTVVNIGDKFSTVSLDSGVRYRDVTHYAVPTGEYWLFDYGVIVFWAITEDERLAILNQIAPRLAIDEDCIEHFRFKFSEQLRIAGDVIELPNEDHLARLAISHALAQSVKLNEFEAQAQQKIEQYSKIPKELARTGKIGLTSRELNKIRGELFSTKSDIILHYELLDTPQFFWEYPQYEGLYSSVNRYLDIQSRLEILDKKLTTITDLFNMLADEQKHHHSSFLEWIIIILIAIEIVFYLAEKLPLLAK